MTEDQELLAEHELFYPSSGVSDAGPFLNHKLHWEIGPIYHKGSLALPGVIHKELQDESWITKKPIYKKIGVDFYWLKEIKKFDVWSLELDSPAYPIDKKHRPFELPYPTYRDFMTWQKLRYLHAKEIGDVNSALSEVRHLMRLIWTNDNLAAASAVIKMLKVENEFEEIIIPKEVGDWKFISHDRLMRAKRYFFAVIAGTDVRVSDETFTRMTKTNTGNCLALYEGMMFYLGMRDLLKNELSYGYDRMKLSIDSSGCRKTILHKMWDDPKWRTMESVADVQILGKKITDVNGSKQSDLIAAIGYKLSSINGPNYSFQYTN